MPSGVSGSGRLARTVKRRRALTPADPIPRAAVSGNVPGAAAPDGWPDAWPGGFWAEGRIRVGAGAPRKAD
ncbi:hypothetical protein GTS_35360 [Gandjariella thermophila]|uniref:Uncharacterized protein n=1 Tax=Gandjariella thermophila TaxID=1931992 RepID=A0A4D4JDF0_9PSEU|nr:hypothetical protein GTS_35360 [Gandjariella thermophila]